MHPVDAPIGQDYGAGKGNLYNPPNGHPGRDYKAPVGTPVRAIADGTVVLAGQLSGHYMDNDFWIVPEWAGKVLVIDHGGYFTECAHLDRVRVRPGDRVRAYQIVADTGNTGSATTGSHLHFGVLLAGYNLRDAMIGRSDPALVTGGMSAAGSITQKEPDMTPEQAKMLAEVHAVLFQGSTDTPRPLTVYDRVVDIQLALTNALPVLLTKPAATLDVAAIAAMIPAAIAQDVADALAERLAG